MNILVIGSGGREHALVWKFAQSPRVERVYCVPGNPGIARTPKAQCVALPVGGGYAELRRFVREQNVGLTFVGPEQPLVDGIVDAFRADGLTVCGPARAAAQLEGSKIFSKRFMQEAGIPTGAAEFFTEAAPALAFLRTLAPPYVIKADGLAAGKGVTVAATLEEAERAVRENLEQGIFGEASRRVVIEEFLAGEEASVLAFTDGRTVLAMPSAQDHKAVFDGDKGPNTGGMGAYSPAPVVTPALEREIHETILQRAVDAMRERGTPYQGILYAGLMIGQDGRPRVIEFNTRFGDPETQPLLMRLESDLAEIALAIAEERLDKIPAPRWSADAAVCVVLASGGYPGHYEKGKAITGLDAAAGASGAKAGGTAPGDATPADGSAYVFHAGTAERDGRIVTAGGRVLGVTARAPRLEDAIARAYDLCGRISFDGCFYRRDIGQKALRRMGK